MSSTEKPRYEYLSVFKIRVNKPLWRQLITCIKGLGVNNVLYLLHKAYPELDPRAVTYESLTKELRMILEKTLESEIMEFEEGFNKMDTYYANCKNRSYSPEFTELVSSKEGNAILFNSRLKSNEKLNIKRLVRMNCTVGYRHFKNYKVHGQSTKSTGRKNKIAKGFIKKKKQKKLDRKLELRN